MKIGVFSVSTPEYSPEETVKMLKSLGYDGVEWRVTTPSPKVKPDGYTYENRYWTYNKSTLPVQGIFDAAKQAKSQCDEAGLEIYSLTSYAMPDDVETIKNVLKAAAEIGCPNMRVLAPGFDGNTNYCSLFDDTKVHLKELEKMAAQFNVRINIEQHMNTIIPSASAAYRLVSECDPKYIGVIFDPGNMVYEGFEDYRIVVQLLGEYIACVHVKNASWQPTEVNSFGARIWKPVWAPIKNGCVNLIAVIDALKQGGYKGYLGIEDFSNELDTKSKLQDNLEFIKDIMNHS